MNLFTSLPILPPLGQFCIFVFQAKANLLLWEAEYPAVTLCCRLGHTSFCILVSLVHSTLFWFVHCWVSRSYLTWPPSMPCPGQAHTAAPCQAQRWGPKLCSRSPHPGPKWGPGCRIQQRQSPACCAHTALPLLQPGPRECWDSTTGPFPAHWNRICSADPAEALLGLSPQLKVTVLRSASAQQHICDGLALQNSHGQSSNSIYPFLSGVFFIKSGQNSDWLQTAIGCSF